MSSGDRAAPSTDAVAHRRLRSVAARPGQGAILLDFDGTLSEIAPRPGEARPVPGAGRVLAGLALRYRLVAVISGRAGGYVAGLLGAPGVRYLGLYGLDEVGPGHPQEGAVPDPMADVPAEVDALVEEASAAVPGSTVERKGATVAVHYRMSPDAPSARETLFARLAVPAGTAGFELIEGKKVIELVPAGWPLKAAAVERLLTTPGIHAALYAGDDLADIEAFEELDRQARRGISTAKVAVQGEETPHDLVEFADVVVDGPAGLVTLLERLAEAPWS